MYMLNSQVDPVEWSARDLGRLVDEEWDRNGRCAACAAYFPGWVRRVDRGDVPGPAGVIDRAHLGREIPPGTLSVEDYLVEREYGGRSAAIGAARVSPESRVGSCLDFDDSRPWTAPVDRIAREAI